MKYQMDDNQQKGARIRVIGIGGAGCNAINRMVEMNIPGIDFIACNTDLQALTRCRASNVLQLGADITHGLGTGGNPQLGYEAVLEEEETIRRHLEGSDMVFITAGMGGGTGTGGAPVVSRIARELNILTIAIVTKPFQFEGRRKIEVAENGIRELQDHADTLIVIPNQRLLNAVEPNTTLKDAFRLADEVLCNAVQGISELITLPGLINLDFADVRTVMASMGKALLGSGIGRGENRAAEAVQRAIRSPLLEDLSIQGARAILINIVGGEDLTLNETTAAVEMIQREADKDANITMGAVIHDSYSGTMKVTVIATGFDAARVKEIPASRVTSLQILSGGSNIDTYALADSYDTPVAASGRSSGGFERPSIGSGRTVTPTYTSAGIPSSRPNTAGLASAVRLQEDPVLDADIHASPREILNPIMFSGHPEQPELEYPSPVEADRDRLPPYSPRNLSSGSFQRKVGVDSESYPVDTSHYMIPAFLRRKAD